MDPVESDSGLRLSTSSTLSTSGKLPKTGPFALGKYRRDVTAPRRAGFFWFFEPSNLELVVKVLDARVVNGHFWVFTAALTNVERTITVIDTDTGATRRYHRPAGDPRGQLDVTAF
mgnify:CR=1 FL=1